MRLVAARRSGMSRGGRRKRENEGMVQWGRRRPSLFFSPRVVGSRAGGCVGWGWGLVVVVGVVYWGRGDGGGGSEEVGGRRARQWRIEGLDMDGNSAESFDLDHDDRRNQQQASRNPASPGLGLRLRLGLCASARAAWGAAWPRASMPVPMPQPCWCCCWCWRWRW